MELELVFKCFVLFGVLAGSFDEDFGAFEQVEDEAFEAFSETEVGDFWVGGSEELLEFTEAVGDVEDELGRLGEGF